MEHVTSKDGTAIGFTRAGEGPQLLLVHGTTADHTRWSGVSPRLETQFTVIAMDRRGRGGSSDGSHYDIRREAEDVAAVVDAIGEPVSALAHSYGAVCTLEAARLTGRLARMVLYEPPIPTGLPMYPPSLPDRMQSLIDGDEGESALEIFFREVVGMPDYELTEYRQMPTWRRRIQLAATIPRELAIDRLYTFEVDKFTDLHVPTCLLLGGDSPPLFQRAVQAVAAALPDATVVVMPGAQHIAMDTDPELFVEEVLRFLLIQ